MVFNLVKRDIGINNITSGYFPSVSCLPLHSGDNTGWARVYRLTKENICMGAKISLKTTHNNLAFPWLR